MTARELHTLLQSAPPPQLLHVLPEEIFAAAHLPGSRNACVYETAFLDHVQALGLDPSAPARRLWRGRRIARRRHRRGKTPRRRLHARAALRGRTRRMEGRRPAARRHRPAPAAARPRWHLPRRYRPERHPLDRPQSLQSPQRHRAPRRRRNPPAPGPARQRPLHHRHGQHRL